MFEMLGEEDNLPGGAFTYDCLNDFTADSVPGTITRTEPKEITAAVGTAIAEEANKWTTPTLLDVTTLQITVKNPFGTPLESVRFNQSPAGCDADVDPEHYRLELETPIEPETTEFVQASFPDYENNENGWSCLIIEDLSPETPDGGSLSKAIALLNAGDYLGAGLAIDEGRLAGTIDDDDVGTFLSDFEPVIRGLPAADALANYHGYLVLEALRPGQSDYLARKQRYREASLQARLTPLQEAIQDASGIVSYRRAVNGLSDDRTRAQRDETWDAIKGLYLEVRGAVTDVRPDGMMSNVKVHLDLGNEVTGTCEVKDFLNDAAKSNLDVGDNVSCKGELFNYTIAFGDLNLSLTKAEFSE